MPKYLYFLLIPLLVSCQATGIKKINNSQLNGKPSTSKPSIQEVTVVVPKKTNSFIIEIPKITQKAPVVVSAPESPKEVQISKQDKIDDTQRIILTVVTEPSTNTVKINNDPPQSISVNFLIFWYGTLILSIGTYFGFKIINKNKKVSISSPEVKITDKPVTPNV